LRAICWVIFVAAGCGRIGFEPVGGAVAGDGGSDRGDVPAPSGLLAWWKLDEGSGTLAADAIGTADAMFQHGISTNTPTWVGGHNGTAFGFVGDADFLLAGPAAALANVPALTVTAWILPGSIAATGAPQCIVAKDDDTTAGWTFGISDDASGDVSFEIVYPPSRQSRVSIGAQVANGRWSHVAATWDGSTSANGIHVYVDGVEPAYASQADAPGLRGDDSAIDFTISRNASPSFTGGVDDVRIYDHVLSPAEVAALATQ